MGITDSVQDPSLHMWFMKMNKNDDILKEYSHL